MPSPFPGMDPYLENRRVFHDLHHRLITAAGDALSPQVSPGYYVAIEERTYIVETEDDILIGHPDVGIVSAGEHPLPGGGGTATAMAEAQIVTLPTFEEVRESYLEIHDARTHEVVTVIEVLSPTNKVGVGRREYEEKRAQVLRGLTNLVEVDLLRAGAPMEMQPQPTSDYRILVRRGWEHPRARLLAFGIRESVPEIEVPLRRKEQPARLGFGDLLQGIYDRARYDLRLDYRQPPDPPLSPEDGAWAEELLRDHGQPA